MSGLRQVLVVPAAGRGSRLGAAKPKALVEVNGRPMLDHLLDLYGPVAAHVIVVVSPAGAGDIAAWARRYSHVSLVEQRQPTGMLDAVLLAAPAVHQQSADSIWITWSDQIGVLPQTVRRLVEAMQSDPPPALALPTVSRVSPYIHFERDAHGVISRLLQKREGDMMPDTGEGDIGLFAMTRAAFDGDLAEYARTVPPGAATGERNFVPFVPWLAARAAVVTIPCTDPAESVGVNTPDDLRQVEAWLRTR